MKKNGYITYGLLIGFHLGVLSMSIYVSNLTDNQDIGGLFSISKKAFLFKYIAIVGLGLIIYNFISIFLDLKAARNEKEQGNKEIESLKAKLFDLQEASKRTEVQQSPEK